MSPHHLLSVSSDAVSARPIDDRGRCTDSDLDVLVFTSELPAVSSGHQPPRDSEPAMSREAPSEPIRLRYRWQEITHTVTRLPSPVQSMPVWSALLRLNSWLHRHQTLPFPPRAACLALLVVRPCPALRKIQTCRLAFFELRRQLHAALILPPTGHSTRSKLCASLHQPHLRPSFLRLLEHSRTPRSWMQLGDDISSSAAPAIVAPFDDLETQMRTARPQLPPS